MVSTMGQTKVIGMGETILDIIFKENQPVAAVPGGSSFNSIISVGRAGVPCSFVGYAGADLVGQQTVDFMHRNGVDTTYFQVRTDEKSALSLAFLDEHGDANYVFYKEHPRAGEGWTLPAFSEGDVLLFGSYFAACTGMRPLVEDMLRRASEAGATVYYDLNFRRSHRDELEALLPTIHSNFRLSSVVRGSADDFDVMYGTRDAREIYEKYVREYCEVFVCTAGAACVTVCTPQGCFDIAVPPVDEVVSTVGAGDNFNAGLACSMIWEGITKNALPHMGQGVWEKIVSTACRFAGEACRTTENYVSHDFGRRMQQEHNC